MAWHCLMPDAEHVPWHSRQRCTHKMGVPGGRFELVVVLNAVFYVRRTNILIFKLSEKILHYYLMIVGGKRPFSD